VARLESALKSRSLAESVLHQVGVSAGPTRERKGTPAVIADVTASRPRRKSRSLEDYRIGP
jgi:hypothetical protein